MSRRPPRNCRCACGSLCGVAAILLFASAQLAPGQCDPPPPPPGTITLTAPLGGEVFPPGESVLITWSTTAPPSTPFWYAHIDASWDSGQTWSSVNNVYGNSYFWNPGFQVCNVEHRRVRVTGYDTCGRSMGTSTGGDFSSQPPPEPSLTISSPNGGESFPFGAIAPITWSSTGSLGATVSIQYSPNNGASWSNITSSTPNDGSHTWTIPSVLTNQGLIRITGTGPCGPVSDTSNYPLVIVPDCDDSAPCTADGVYPPTGECVHFPITCGDCDVDEACDEVPCWNRHCVNGHCEYSPTICVNLRPCEYRYCNPFTGECETMNLCQPGLCCTDDGCVPCDFNQDGVLDGLDIQGLVEAVVNGMVPLPVVQNYYVPRLLGMAGP